MNGIESAARASPRWTLSLRSTLVVVLTTSNEERDRADAYRLNVAGYFWKLLTFVHFVEQIVGAQSLLPADRISLT